MPPIKNWKKQSKAPVGFCYVWEHEETGQKIAVTDKIPNDGYYIFKFEEDEVVRQGNGDHIGYHHIKKWAKRIAVDEIRNKPEGY